MRGPANRSPSHGEPVSGTIDPVSGVPKRKLKNDEQRLGPEKRPSRTRRPRIDAQRLRHASLSRRNVGGTRAPGNDTAETGLFGWGCSRMRTRLSLHFWEMQGDFDVMQGGGKRSPAKSRRISEAWMGFSLLHEHGSYR